MLEIKPCLDKQTVAQMCRSCGKAYTQAFYVYLAQDKGKTLAMGLFEVRSRGAGAVFYQTTCPDDVFLLDGIIRAGFHYAEQHNLQEGYLDESFLQSAGEPLKQLNLPRESVFLIENFFQKYKNCTNR